MGNATYVHPRLDTILKLCPAFSIASGTEHVLPVSLTAKEIRIHTAYVHTVYIIGLYPLRFQTYAYTCKIKDTVKP